MLEEIKKLDKQYYMNTFGERLPVAFEKGEGMKPLPMTEKNIMTFWEVLRQCFRSFAPKFIKALKAQGTRFCIPQVFTI